MKIDNNDQIMKSLYLQETAKSRPVDENEFGRIFKETVENAQKNDARPRQTVFTNPLAGVWRTAPGSADPKVTINRIENMIDLLDQYRHKLADPQLNLKQIDPIINEIARENDHLASIADSLPDDAKIKNILDLTMVTASLEVSKFYRGDYLPT